MKISKQVVRAALCTCVVVGLFAGPAVAKRITGSQSGQIPSIDVNGNVDFGDSTGVDFKAVKYTRSGIVINRGRGRVTNLTGRTAIIRDAISGIVFDPELNGFSSSTRERYVVSRRRGEGRALASHLIVRNPRRVEDSQVN